MKAPFPIPQPTAPNPWRLFTTLVLEGQRVDWKHSLVIVLVICGMFSTPLVLGSIRNRVYEAVREQVEKENNVRQIGLQPTNRTYVRLDADFAAELEARYPGTRVIGNHQVVISVEGPDGSDLATAESWTANDPRHSWLGVVPTMTRELALDEVVVSDHLGRLLYGQSWEAGWSEGAFSGPALRLRINDLPLRPSFRVVARRSLSGKGFYLSPVAVRELRRYSLGYGSASLGLPVIESLVQLGLPDPLSSQCTLLVRANDTSCGDEELEVLQRRLEQQQWQLLPPEQGRFGHLPGQRSLRLQLRQFEVMFDQAALRSFEGDCGELIGPYLAETCRQAVVVPELEFAVVLAAEAVEVLELPLVAAPTVVAERLPQAEELLDRHGGAPPVGGVLDLVAAVELGLEPGTPLQLLLGETSVSARVGSLYACAEYTESEERVAQGAAGCPLFAPAHVVAHLRGVAEGTVLVRSQEPLVFVPAGGGETFDEILVYAPSVEAVEGLVDSLRDAYPSLSLRYNVAALNRLLRQDGRLATLFTLTMVLAALFIVLALGALTRLDVERRKRQLAQLLILGRSRRFVRRLIVGELLLLTSAAALLAAALTEALCGVARTLLARQDLSAEQDFAVIVSTMGLDGTAFLQVSAVVFGCTLIVAIISAHLAARTDPVTLLD